MHVNKTKALAVLGVMAALSTVLTVLGTVISVNTLFFTAAAAFLVGVAVCFYGMGYGTIFFFVCLLLDFFINPNKLHVLLYLGLAGYILLSEGSFLLLDRMTDDRKKAWLHRGIRFLIFAVIYVPFVFFFPQLFLSDSLLAKRWIVMVMLPAGIFAWLVYDLAYFIVKKISHERFGKMLS